MNFKRNHQKKIMNACGDDILFFASAPEKVRSNDSFYTYRQDSDFIYLVGESAPNHVLVLNGKKKESHLFIPDLDDKHRVWVGHQMTTSEAKKVFPVDHVHYISEFKKIAKNWIKGSKRFVCTHASLAELKKFGFTPAIVKKCTHLRIVLDEARARKSPEEIELIIQTNKISKEGHFVAMRTARPQIHEYQVQAAMEQVFRSHGSTANAYNSIVATGTNGAVLHYHDNNAVLKKGDLMLIDAACELHGYASDITRTFPVSKKFSARQAEIYDIVLKTQTTSLAAAKPGITMMDLHLKACRTLSQGLIDVGILKNRPLDEIIQSRAFAIFFPHGLGHMMGIDVHDVGGKDPFRKVAAPKGFTLRTARLLEKDFVITIEPGIYFIDAYFDSKETRKKFADFIDWKVAEKYRDVGGIRIEDDIAITATGHKNLTNMIKTRREIEEFLADRTIQS